MSDWVQCRLMLNFALRHKRTLLIQLLATMGHIITRMLFPIVVGFAITTLTSTSDDNIIISDGIMTFLCDHDLFLHCGTKMDLLNSTVWLMVYVNIGQTIFNLLRKYFGGLTTQRMSSEIRNQLFHSMLWHDLSFYECSEQWSSGTLLNRLGADCKKFTNFSTGFIPNVMDNIFGVLFGLCYALYISPFMTLIMLCSVPISTMLSRVFAQYSKEMAMRKQDILGSELEDE